MRWSSGVPPDITEAPLTKWFLDHGSPDGAPKSHVELASKTLWTKPVVGKPKVISWQGTTNAGELRAKLESDTWLNGELLRLNTEVTVESINGCWLTSVGVFSYLGSPGVPHNFGWPERYEGVVCDSWNVIQRVAAHVATTE
jgi:hypothetical protein